MGAIFISISALPVPTSNQQNLSLAMRLGVKWVVPILHNQVDVLKVHAPFVVGSVCAGGWSVNT